MSKKNCSLPEVLTQAGQVFEQQMRITDGPFWKNHLTTFAAFWQKAWTLPWKHQVAQGRQRNSPMI